MERSPEAIALVFEERTLSYAELNAQANRLAHLLIGRGVGPEDLVALALPRSIEMVVALLGILKAGAAYLPLDPDYPVERLSSMLAGRSAGLCPDQRPRSPSGCRRVSLSSCLITPRRLAHWLRARRLTPRTPSAPSRSVPTTLPTSSTPQAQRVLQKALLVDSHQALAYGSPLIGILFGPGTAVLAKSSSELRCMLIHRIARAALARCLCSLRDNSVVSVTYPPSLTAQFERLCHPAGSPLCSSLRPYASTQR